MSGKDSHDVGYGRRPNHTKFKKGQSGNPSGRPRRDHTMAGMFRRIFATKVRTADGRSVTITEAIIQQTFISAAKGDARARREVFQLIDKYNVGEAFMHHVTIELVKAPPRDADGNLIRKRRKKKPE